jgi:hypothetical protein
MNLCETVWPTSWDGVDTAGNGMTQSRGGSMRQHRDGKMFSAIGSLGSFAGVQKAAISGVEFGGLSPYVLDTVVTSPHVYLRASDD